MSDWHATAMANRRAPERGPSACRYCGGKASGDIGAHGWRVCGRCDPIDATGSHALLWRTITGDERFTDDADGLAVTRAVESNPAYFVTGASPSEAPHKPWSHLRSGVALDAQRALTDIENRRTPNPESRGKPCAWCGVRRAVGWKVARSIRWPDGTEGVLCGDCSAVYFRHGAPGPTDYGYGDLVTAALTDLPASYGLSLDVRTASDDDRTGADTRWAWLDDATITAARVRLMSTRPALTARYASEAERLLIAERIAEHRRRQTQPPPPLIRL